MPGPTDRSAGRADDDSRRLDGVFQGRQFGTIRGGGASGSRGASRANRPGRDRVGSAIGRAKALATRTVERRPRRSTFRRPVAARPAGGPGSDQVPDARSSRPAELAGRNFGPIDSRARRPAFRGSCRPLRARFSPAVVQSYAEGHLLEADGPGRPCETSAPRQRPGRSARPSRTLRPAERPARGRPTRVA